MDFNNRKLNMRCSKCGAECSDDSTFCNMCGYPLIKKCCNCGNIVATSDRFCSKCGNRLDKDKELNKYEGVIKFFDNIFVYNTSLGNYIVVRENGKYGILDSHTLKAMTLCQFEDFKNSHLAISILKKAIFLKKNGKWIHINPFNGNKISVQDFDEIQINESGFTFNARIGTKWGQLECETGKMFFDFIFDEISYDNRLKYNGYWGYINNDRIVVPYEYIHLSSYTFVDNIRPSQYKNGKWGVINFRNGKITIDFVYDEIEYHEPFGHSLYYLRQGEKWGLYFEGKLFPCKYSKEEVKYINYD